MATIDDVYAEVLNLRHSQQASTWTTGTESAHFTGHGYYTPPAAGTVVAIKVNMKVVPTYYGFEGDKTEDGQYLDVGWVLPYYGSGRGTAEVWRLGPFHLLIGGQSPFPAFLYYWLPPGVEATFTPYYLP